MPDTRVLVVDDERSMRELLAIMLKQAGHDVTVADGGEAAIRALQSNAFDLVITDLRMRQVDGLAVLRAAKEHSPQTVVLVVTAFASTETAVEAMKLGAYDYLTKPFKLDEIKLTIANALERKRLQDENQALKRQLRRERGFESFIGKSRQMLDIFDTIRKAAETRQARCCIQSEPAARINASAVVGFIATRPGNPLVRSSTSSCHPRRATRPTTATRTLEARLSDSRDETNRRLTSVSRDGAIRARSRSLMARAEPRSGGASARLGRGPGRARA